MGWGLLVIETSRGDGRKKKKDTEESQTRLSCAAGSSVRKDARLSAQSGSTSGRDVEDILCRDTAAREHRAMMRFA